MNTAMLLMAQYGLAVVPADRVARDYFGLTTEKFVRKVAVGEIRLPLVRMTGSQKSARGVHVADLHFHDLRHDGISRHFELGNDIPAVAAISGHRDWNSLRRYTHLRGNGDKYAGEAWIEKDVALEWSEPMKRKKPAARPRPVVK